MWKKERESKNGEKGGRVRMKKQEFKFKYCLNPGKRYSFES